MNDTLLDISGKVQHHRAAVLGSVDRVARKLCVPFVVVGAAARDFIMENGHGITTLRATQDIDIGIEVPSWERFAALCESLQSDEHFRKTEIEHRFESPTAERTSVDVLPYGPIENGKRAIRWQRENREMNMAGFSEAGAAAIDVRISSNPEVLVKVVSLPGLALLKLVSWNDLPEQRDRDAKDFRLLMYRYLDAKPTEYVFDVHPDIASDGDYEMTSARALGRDMRTLAGPRMSPTIGEILLRECEPAGDLRFVQQMQPSYMDHDLTIERDLVMLRAVLHGVSDTSGPH